MTVNDSLLHKTNAAFKVIKDVKNTTNSVVTFNLNLI